MSRKPTISPSKIATYLACPVKYRWTYIDSRGRWYLRAKSYYSFGNTLHRVLQEFHGSDKTGVEAREEAMAAYDENWIDAGFSSAEEMAEAYGEGKFILERHMQETALKPVTAKTLYVERQFRSDFGSFDLIGRVDRVDEHEDGSLEIVDYKSGRLHVTEEEVAHDLALGCYQLLLKEKFPQRLVRATIVALRTGVSATASLDDPQLQELRQDLRKLGELILTEDFHDIIPRPKRICARCDFAPLCLRHEEFRDQQSFYPPAGTQERMASRE